MPPNKGPAPGKFQNIQKDIERRIERAGRVEKRPDGFLVDRGYYRARDAVIAEHLEAKAYEPLVRHFRGWNWEVGDNDFLRDLTAALKRDKEWHHLKKLWDGVISKRERHFRQVEQLRAREPKAITAQRADHVRALLASAVKQLRDLAGELNQPAEAQALDRKLSRIENK